MKEANIIILAKEPNCIIEDIGPWSEYPTITNDVENVVHRIVAAGLLPEGKRLFYYDSEGNLDEIVVKYGRFAGFKTTDRKGKI